MAGEKDTYFDDKRSENQFQGESYNLLGTLGAAMPSAILGVMAVIKSNEAKNDLKKQQTRVDSLMKNYMSTPIYNPYDNLSVANKANEIKMQETDKALANTLDTLRAQGASAGGATALAQAALKSKAGIAADIEKQEVANEKLKAQGEIMVQNAEMQRKGQFMDYEQSKADQLRTEQFGYGERAADMAGALGSLGLQASRSLNSNENAASSGLEDITDSVEEVVVEDQSPGVNLSNLPTNDGGGDGNTAMERELGIQTNPTLGKNYPGYKQTTTGYGQVLGQLAYNQNQAKAEGKDFDVYQKEILRRKKILKDKLGPDHASKGSEWGGINFD